MKKHNQTKIKIHFWNNQKMKTKEFKTRTQLHEYIRQHNLYMYDLNGYTHITVGGND